VIEEIEDIASHSDSDIGLSLRLFADALSLPKRIEVHREELLLKLGLALFCLALFVLVTLGGILSANVVLDSTALCKSSHCGLWGSYSTLTWDSEWAQVKTVTEKRNPGVNLAAACYRGPSSSNVCGILFSGRIPYTLNLSASCPLNGDVCIGGTNNAFELDTGYRDTQILGIVSSQRFLFGVAQHVHR
jgi:hypothetical protein